MTTAVFNAASASGTSALEAFSPEIYDRAVQALPSDAIRGQIAAQHNSIHHLQRTNDELRELMAEQNNLPPQERDDSEVSFLRDTIEENDEAMARQRHRIAIMEQVLRKRGELPADDSGCKGASAQLDMGGSTLAGTSTGEDALRDGSGQSRESDGGVFL
ncbi:hypothetical protein THASP1DRAFT_33090 [Thamnocephalis sphaerospora]|uniref:Uncharacterized protein n=1 Tax=Thamnocephalis sphaerospora TaxID=78915 RepID=A0A4P9XIA0_9FUNG|nr:hypothetical protein THASP1DRAFT_33090 [Thamnocephalis sphaerospora]|eukprot:RKP05081.1 hypothetical protein THASP1DRAFT_33090 [Thamnocephalis sphaerospora]